jgi:hypothetical protein
LKEAKVFAWLVVLVLAIWGVSRLRAPTGRADHAEATLADACDLPLTISRGAGVRRSFPFAPRAPGLLCERAFVIHPRRKPPLAGPRAFRPALWSRRRDHVRAHSIMRSIVMRA